MVPLDSLRRLGGGAARGVLSMSLMTRRLFQCLTAARPYSAKVWRNWSSACSSWMRDQNSAMMISTICTHVMTLAACPEVAVGG
jgi:hypothetical protein